MKTAKEIFDKHKNLYQFEEGSPEYLIDEVDFVDALKEYTKQLLEKYTNRVVENAEIRVTEDALIEDGETYSSYSDGVFTIFVDKESITSQLPKFLNEIEL